MRKAILAGFTSLALAGAAAGVAYAQPAQPPPAAAPGAAQMDNRAHPHRMDSHRGDDRHHGDRMQRHRSFGLLYPQEDRKLTPPDVQKIAEAFLLWHGNHTWKVTEVAPAADGTIGFAIATPEGSVIARFTMDPRTAKVTRKG